SSITPTHSNAQTFYQCLPISCPAGEYKENNTCKKCPAGTYNPNAGSITSADCKPCIPLTHTYKSDTESCIKWLQPGGCVCGEYGYTEYNKDLNVNSIVSTPTALSGCGAGGKLYLKKRYSTSGSAVQYLGCDSSSGALKLKIYKDCGNYSNHNYNIKVDSQTYCNPNKTSIEEL
ncbi:MAG: hypothetical protein ACI4N3_04805, partial [Alphaproteobacteria bacterium]